ncbi:putative protein FAM90A9P [Mesocricetus auratus]|uniref:Uncharacterized protein n=1 Tax=Mesocricetus auratus TaxID=10036 RepID=A0ABM2X6L4_MESAU|nr:putative protein FAM90A9P [Mesocricetus auratus]
MHVGQLEKKNQISLSCTPLLIMLNTGGINRGGSSDTGQRMLMLSSKHAQEYSCPSLSQNLFCVPGAIGTHVASSDSPASPEKGERARLKVPCSDLYEDLLVSSSSEDSDME